MHNTYKGLLKAGAALCMFISAGVAFPVTAATILPSPNKVSVNSGDVFSVRYSLDPRGDINYTVKLILSFSTPLLKVETFALANGWVALSQPGYDLTDAANGILIKTAGYPNGISSPALFATVRFRAIGVGVGTIDVQGSSVVLNAENKNVLETHSAVTNVVVNAKSNDTTPKSPPAAVQEKEGQNLFDVEIGVAPAQGSFNWLPWAIIAFLLCFATGCFMLMRKRPR